MDDVMFDAVPVTPAEARRAHRVVALSHPAVSLAEWKRYVRTAIPVRRTDSGIVALYDGRRCIHALFAYRIARSLGRDATLQVTEITTLRLPGTVLVKSLMRFADGLADAMALSSIAIEMQLSEVWTADRHAMEQRGFTADRVLMRGRPNNPVVEPAES